VSAGNKKTSTGLEQNVAGLLTYVLGWVTGVIFLIIEKEDKFVRFHAWQSILVFGAYNVLIWVIYLIPFVGFWLGPILSVVAFISWVLLMYKAYRGEMYKFPVAGNIAQTQAK